MMTQGLLVEGDNGEDFLLTTEPHVERRTQRLVVLQKINGTWQRIEGAQASTCREALIGAFVDFFVDLCRVLNSSEREPVAKVVPIRRPMPARPRSVHAALRTQERHRYKGKSTRQE